MKKFLIALTIFFLFGAVTILLVLAPAGNPLENLPIVGQLYKNTSLTINFPKGRATILVNDKNYGETNQTITDLPEGTHTVKLTRISSDTNASKFYQDASFIVELKNNTETIINTEIGPSGVIAGYVLYYTDAPADSSNNGFINIISVPETTNIYLDDDFVSKTPVKLQKFKAGNYTLKAVSEGYESLEFPIILRSNYNLNINLYLFPIPMVIEKE